LKTLKRFAFTDLGLGAAVSSPAHLRVRHWQQLTCERRFWALTATSTRNTSEIHDMTRQVSGQKHLGVERFMHEINQRPFTESNHPEWSHTHVHGVNAAMLEFHGTHFLIASSQENYFRRI